MSLKLKKSALNTDNKKRHPHQNGDGEPVNAPKWKNLMFDIYGKSYRGVMTHNSEKEAKDVSDECDKKVQLKIKYYPLHAYDSLDGDLPGLIYSHTIQVPYKD